MPPSRPRHAAFPGVARHTAHRARARVSSNTASWSRPTSISALLAPSRASTARPTPRRAVPSSAASRTSNTPAASPPCSSATHSSNIARGVDCETINMPLGVCVGITPFNFPAMVPLWIVPDGHRVRQHLRPEAEREGPAQRRALLGQLLEQAGCPKGVVQRRPRRPRRGRRAPHPPEGRAISFVGSTPIAKYIYRNRHQARQTRPGQRRREELHRRHARRRRRARPSKTSPPPPSAAPASAAWPGSSALVVGAAADRVLPESGEGRQRHQGRPHRSRSAQPDMGPVITAAHRDRVLSLLATGETGGRQDHRRRPRGEGGRRPQVDSMSEPRSSTACRTT